MDISFISLIWVSREYITTGNVFNCSRGLSKWKTTLLYTGRSMRMKGSIGFNGVVTWVDGDSCLGFSVAQCQYGFIRICVRLSSSVVFAGHVS